MSFGIGVSLVPHFLFAANTRHPYDHPFHPNNIWNTPIGSQAEYSPANLDVNLDYFGVDEDVIVTTPTAPLTPVWYNNIGWSSNAQNARCFKSGGRIDTIPLPSNFLVLQPAGSTPNASAAVLRPDGRTFYQTQPLARCQQGGNAFTLVDYQDADLFGMEYRGAHGGSGLSSIGGTIRLGELVGSEEINHVLKVNLYADKHLAYPADGTPGYRWPAWKADSYAADAYKGPNPKVEMGTLLALLPSYNESNLSTEPARKIARALKNYGAYVADDSAWNAIDFAVEQGPEGKVKDEFPARWGFNMNMGDKNHPWFKDLQDIFANLHVVDNNSSLTVGGGGVRRTTGAEAVNYIQGNIWIDQNQNGIQEQGEESINSVTTTLVHAGPDEQRGTGDDYLPPRNLFGSGMSTTASGTQYIFKDLTPGKYFIRFEGEFPENALTGGESIKEETVVSGLFEIGYDQTAIINLGLSIATNEEQIVVPSPPQESAQQQLSSENTQPEDTPQTITPQQQGVTPQGTQISEPTNTTIQEPENDVISEDNTGEVIEGSIDEQVQQNEIEEVRVQVVENTKELPLEIAVEVQNETITSGEKIVFSGSVDPTREDIDLSGTECLFSILTPSGLEYRAVQPLSSDGKCEVIMGENPAPERREWFPRATPLAASLPIDIPVGIYESGYGSVRLIIEYDERVIHSEANIWRITYPGGEIAEILSIVANDLIMVLQSDAGVLILLSVLLAIAAYWVLHRAVLELDEDFQIIDRLDRIEDKLKDLYQDSKPEKKSSRKRINRRK